VTSAWPEIALAGWNDTYLTLQLWTQLAGKTRLALSPPQNHYWHVALYLTSRGIGTSPVPAGGRTFEVDFDFLNHRLVVHTSDGRTGSLSLEPRTVADFCERYLALLRSLDIDARIRKFPCEVANPIPFLEDTVRYATDLHTRRWASDTLVQTRNYLEERDELEAENRKQQEAYEKMRAEYEKKYGKPKKK